MRTTTTHIGEAFLTLLRTKQFLSLRLRAVNDSEGVHIPQKDVIEREYFIYPLYNRKEELQKLIDAGELEITEEIINGKKTLFYRALQPGPIDLSLVKLKDQPEYGPDTETMKRNLLAVSLTQGAASTEYFDLFLANRDTYLDLFFTVDRFAKRIHTPVSNFHRTHRPGILLNGEKTASLDVKTMQPLILGLLLKKYVGHNQFSTWIDLGEDIYVMLQNKAGLKTRDEGKKRYFEIAYGPANNELARLFGQANWISWINAFKSSVLAANPHNKAKRYSNLAWLLQTTEVKIMRKVWRRLNEENIIFLSVHDEIIAKAKEQAKAESLMHEVLSKEFNYYKINTK